MSLDTGWRIVLHPANKSVLAKVMTIPMVLPGDPKPMSFGANQSEPLLWLRQQKKSTDQPAIATEVLTENELRANPVLCCSACLHQITSMAERIELLGQHEHHCTNPHGIQFWIGCFAEAGGCKNTGDWISKHSWFAGYLWRYSLCAACHTHLGWQFRSDQNGFFGLIKARLLSYEQLH
ncbi:MAG: hypothetical protein JXA04_10385 [Gammaproteobacteria bacterium]|nr:hypothetical protein [Gammaproteobacteria bacterium]